MTLKLAAAERCDRFFRAGQSENGSHLNFTHKATVLPRIQVRFSLLITGSVLEDQRDTLFSGTSWWLIDATIMLFSADQSMEHSSSQITPVALQAEIITNADSHGSVMADDM